MVYNFNYKTIVFCDNFHNSEIYFELLVHKYIHKFGFILINQEKKVKYRTVDRIACKNKSKTN